MKCIRKISSILFLCGTLFIYTRAQVDDNDDEPSIELASDVANDETEVTPQETTAPAIDVVKPEETPITTQSVETPTISVTSDQAIATTVTEGAKPVETTTKQPAEPSKDASQVALKNAPEQEKAAAPVVVLHANAPVESPATVAEQSSEIAKTQAPSPEEHAAAAPSEPVQTSKALEPGVPTPSPVVPLPTFIAPAPLTIEERKEHLALANKPLQTQLIGPFTHVSINQALTQLAPLIMSRSVEKAVTKFTNTYPDKALQILETLIKTSKIDFTKKNAGRPFEVRRNDLLQIIFGVASQYRSHAMYNQFFDFIEQYPGLYHGIRPLLFVLSISSYPVLIPDLIEWLDTHGEKDSLSTASFYAIDRNSTRSIKALSTYAPSALKPLLGPLLFYAISNNKAIKMITTLLDAGADPNYSDPSGYTPLIKAVALNNLPLTKLLVERGADMDLILKDEIGSAWQKSTELIKSDIMDYLREKNKKAPHMKLPLV